ncbi:SRA stem-loop-interacting RNA-binding protein, mitochondrial [Hyperolius riggenbachi]|uniref:SRA stem-loop-interacting RNA-binding protein, mitochondrial n=1 Tax=Hyperolius riggenbachi TaxID=752182 RepID=UPI0035A2FD07
MQAAEIFVRRLPFTVGSRELREYFSQFGRVMRCDIALDRKTGIQRSYGWVSFGNKVSAQKVLEQEDHILEGYKLEIKACGDGEKKEEFLRFEDHE